MGMTRCNKCRHPFSTDEKSCPACGEQYSKIGCATYLVLGILAMILIVAFKDGVNSKSTEKQNAASEKSHVLTRQEIIESHFSKWDGSHPELEKYIKNTMKNPNSYEHVETKYLEQGDIVVVQTKYRGTNSFGAVVTEKIIAECSIDGRVLKIVK